MPVSLTITPEGDATIDVPTVENLQETDLPIRFTLGEYLDPMATDADGSETITTLVLTVTGLPGDPLFDETSISGLPGPLDLTTAADGTQTLRATLTGDTAVDVFSAVEITVPGDFSTEIRSDVAGATSLPINIAIDIRTDEDQVSGDNLPADGEVSANANVIIDFEDDLTLIVGPDVTEPEDQDIANVSIGVTATLGLSIGVDDRDFSEDPGTSGGDFGTLVTVNFSTLPNGAKVFALGDMQTLSAEGIWTGTVDKANDLSVFFPGNYAGTVEALVTVETPEGSRTDSKLINITPTSDVLIDGEVITFETDDVVPVVLSDTISVIIDPSNERLLSLEFTLPGLPPGTRAFDTASGDELTTFTPGPGGTQTFTFSFRDALPAPDGDGADDTTGYRPENVRIDFPADYSTTSPDIPLQAELVIESIQSGSTIETTSTIDITIIEEGFDPKADSYYNEVDKRMRDTFPHKFESSTPTQSVAAVNRGGPTRRKGTVRLTPSQVAISKKLGVPLSEYAKYVKE